jgi:hypothetical protein
VKLSPLGTSATNWPVVPVRDDRWWAWSSRWNVNLPGETEILGENLHHKFKMTWPRTRAVAVGSRLLTAWAMARPTQAASCTYLRLVLCFLEWFLNPEDGGSTFIRNFGEILQGFALPQATSENLKCRIVSLLALVVWCMPWLSWWRN